MVGALSFGTTFRSTGALPIVSTVHNKFEHLVLSGGCIKDGKNYSLKGCSYAEIHKSVALRAFHARAHNDMVW